MDTEAKEKKKKKQCMPTLTLKLMSNQIISNMHTFGL